MDLPFVALVLLTNYVLVDLLVRLEHLFLTDQGHVQEKPLRGECKINFNSIEAQVSILSTILIMCTGFCTNYANQYYTFHVTKGI